MLALLYDIHGNLPALEAVLADARTAGAASFVLGGDYALFGPWPRETVERLRALPARAWVRGNGERWTAHPDQAPDDAVVQGAVQACDADLGARLVAELDALPEQAVLCDTLYCHASPVSDVQSFAPSAQERDRELLGDARDRRVVFGHTHLPFRREGPGGVELVNPGSVGMPFDGDPRAAYALVREGGEVEHRRVAYDHGASARALRERYGGGWAAVVAARIEHARVDPDT